MPIPFPASAPLSASLSSSLSRSASTVNPAPARCLSFEEWLLRYLDRPQTQHRKKKSYINQQMTNRWMKEKIKRATASPHCLLACQQWDEHDRRLKQRWLHHALLECSPDIHPVQLEIVADSGVCPNLYRMISHIYPAL